MEDKTVIVTGIGGNVGQGILRNLADMNLPIKIIGTDIAEFTPGNYLCHKTYKIPYAYDSDYIDTIQTIVDKEEVDLVIPSTDYEIYYLGLNKDRINAIVLASDASISEIYLDKYKTYLHHKNLDIPFANSYLPEEYDFSYPEILAKPRQGRGSRGILINPIDLKSLPDNYMIQPLLKGPEITTTAYITKASEIHGIFSMERELTNGTTSKSKVVFDYDPQFINIFKKMIVNTGLKGSINLQSIISKEGEIVPFEVNCRISGTNSIRHKLGFQDVKYAIQEYLYDEKPSKPTPIHGVATRILIDVVYPNAINETELNNKSSNHLLY